MNPTRFNRIEQKAFERYSLRDQAWPTYLFCSPIVQADAGPQALTGDGWAVLASDDDTVKVWNLNPRTCLANFTADGALSQDGLIIAACASGHVHFLRLVGLD